MRKPQWLAVLGLAGWLAASVAEAQIRPYIGFVYPAGGRAGVTTRIRLGGQGLDGVNEAIVSGRGVSAKVAEYHRRMNNQETALIREQAAELKRGKSSKSEATQKLIARIEERLAEAVPAPAAASLANLVLVDVTIAPDAEPGRRELVLATPHGVSNPLVFYVDQLPEVSRKPMLSASIQTLGKEEMALRKRPDDEMEQRVTVPCVVNGQIASREVNRYRFEARKGQRLLMRAQARECVPFLADAVPGWFQPVMMLRDASGKEVAYNDDYRFQPDPVIFYEVPKDGEYLLDIYDAIYRGREDFVYRITIGELPFVTSIFPLGGRVGEPIKVKLQGWNLEGAETLLPAPDAGPGIQAVAARRAGAVSNRLPFVLDTLPECFEQEPNNDPAHAQAVKLPIIINGRIDRPDDWDVFKFVGRAGEKVVAEVMARRLDSPLDSIVKITDAKGNVLGVNDDHEDAEAGTNTHDADSYLMVELPADGTYYVHLGDAARHGGGEYAYRLRISAPRPDFALFAVPTSAAIRSKSSGPLTFHVVRKDGFAGPIKLALKDPPAGFSAFPVSLLATQTTRQLVVKTDLVETKHPVQLTVEGRALIDGREVVHAAMPAEDRMQAFLWRHLVPAKHFNAVVFQPPPPLTPVIKPKAGTSAIETKPKTPPAGVSTGTAATARPKFTKQQVFGRVREIKALREEKLLTPAFSEKKIAECEADL